MHAPQLAASVFKSTHTPLQSVNPAAQVGTQAPDEQVCPAGHTVPQEPQFLGSLVTFVQTAAAPVPQICFGATQVQVDEEQTSPAMQTAPQPPQLDALTAVSTQVPVAEAGGQSATVEGVVLHAQAAAAQVPSPQE